MELLTGKEEYAKEEQTLAFNTAPFIGPLNSQGFCEEEEKIMFETRKIMGLPDLKISAFTLRVPSWNSHGQVVWADFENPPPEAKDLGAVYNGVKGVFWSKDSPPHARQVSGKKDVFIGRIHKDPCFAGSYIMWIAADNLLKGAALNGWQIAQKLWEMRRI